MVQDIRENLDLILRKRSSINIDYIKKKILIIITGGTICMAKSGIYKSLAPASIKKKIIKLSEFTGRRELPEFDINEWDQLVDSSDMNLELWLKIANDIKQNYDSYDGFVILHGTDTLAYTASALSFMLEYLNKSVILTGSMLPFYNDYNDALNNVTVAMKIAAYSNIPEVCILFGSRLLRGNRSTKIDCSQMDAFDSPNFSHLGSIGVNIKVNETLLLIPPKNKLQVFESMYLNIPILSMTPNFQPYILNLIFESINKPLGLILQLYGTGTAPMKNEELLISLRNGIKNGISIVCISQCKHGSCSLMTYENGALLHQLGIIEGKDMTVEAAFGKLSYLLGKGYKGEKLRYLMETDIRGELTEHLRLKTGQTSLTRTIPQIYFETYNNDINLLKPISLKNKKKFNISWL